MTQAGIRAASGGESELQVSFAFTLQLILLLHLCTNAFAGRSAENFNYEVCKNMCSTDCDHPKRSYHRRTKFTGILFLVQKANRCNIHTTNMFFSRVYFKPIFTWFTSRCLAYWLVARKSWNALSTWVVTCDVAGRRIKRCCCLQARSIQRVVGYQRCIKKGLLEARTLVELVFTML